MKLPKAVERNLDKIIPYENNPRRIPPEAVAAVKDSIDRYGYVQPIVVDSEGVIVIGHTRYAALKELGHKKAMVYVVDLPPEKVRELRIVDNRTAELGQWDHSALVMELREWEQGLLEEYFPDLDLEVGELHDALVSNEDVDEAVKKVARVAPAPPLATVEVTCPACFHTFEVKATSLPGLSNADVEELNRKG